MGEIREEGNKKMSVTKNGDGESRNKGSLNRDEAQTVRRCGRKTGRRNQRSEHVIHPGQYLNLTQPLGILILLHGNKRCETNLQTLRPTYTHKRVTPELIDWSS